jgi:hypothetical protein
MNWRDAVTGSAGFSAITWQHGVEDPDHRPTIESFVANLAYGPAIIMRLRADASRVLFTRESLLAVLRIAVIEESTAVTSLLEYMDYFTKANLMANELIHNEINPPEHTGTSADLLRTELRSYVLKLENPHDLLAPSVSMMGEAS